MNWITLKKVIALGFLGIMATQAITLEARRGWGGRGGRGGGWHRGGRGGIGIGFGFGGGRRGWGWGGPGWRSGYYSPTRTVYVEPTTTTYVQTAPTISDTWTIRNRIGSTLVIENSRGDLITLAPGERRRLAKDGGNIIIKSHDGAELTEFDDLGNSNSIAITGSGDDITLELKK